MLFRSIISACAAGVYVAEMIPTVPWPVRTMVAGILYLAGLVFLGAFRKKEREDLFALLGPQGNITGG